ncbi:hypothetical protein HOP50_04g29090 [Chloropicon primus]|uniref:Uncharacterized protein n=1 Tax=Chloropicon primus TaxID=1764295 RepID=A0A5B8MM05_9CHLO|nr:hypothetical protein A3770_04p29100 [Chloropicon primus]UPQ99601.1 hypothetical protein HOP50_04g29090 [Chloropicon primus]|eukprot:QDZ20392.1 hypothetical protein A3770_04p29100 [Chloropicon primus]
MPLSSKKAKCRVVRKSVIPPKESQETMARVLEEIKVACEDGLVTEEDYLKAKASFLKQKQKQMERIAEINQDFLTRRLEREQAMHFDLLQKKQAKEELMHAYKLVLDSNVLTRGAKESAEREFLVSMMGGSRLVGSAASE